MGAFSILNNIAGLNAQHQLASNQAYLSRTLARLSSGKRINTGADDAAGLQIADGLRASILAFDQAVRNANDGITVSQIADGALQEITNILTRAATLADEAANGTMDSSSRASLNAEFTQIQDEIARIATQTSFNGMALFTTDGLNGGLSIFVGDTFASSSIAVTISTISTNGNTVTSLGGQDLSKVSLTTQDGAAAALKTIKDALTGIAAERAAIGAGINRLQSAASVIQNQSQNTQAAESTIRDADIAEEISNLTKCQILTQSALAALSPANTSSQVVLTLFKSLG